MVRLHSNPAAPTPASSTPVGEIDWDSAKAGLEKSAVTKQIGDKPIASPPRAADEQPVGDDSAPELSIAISPEIQAVIDRAVDRAVAVALGRGPADSMGGWLSIAQMVPHMPPGAKSEVTIRRWIKAGLLRAEKRRGCWAIDPGQAFADLKQQAGGATAVKDFLATWTLKKAEEKKARFGRRFPGAKRRKS